MDRPKQKFRTWNHFLPSSNLTVKSRISDTHRDGKHMANPQSGVLGSSAGSAGGTKMTSMSLGGKSLWGACAQYLPPLGPQQALPRETKQTAPICPMMTGMKEICRGCCESAG